MSDAVRARDVPGAPAADAPGELDRFGDVERVDRHLHLRQVGAQLAGRVRVGDEVEATERDATGGRLQKADGLLDKRRLAGPVRAEQSVDLARLDAEGDGVVGDNRAEALRETLDAERPVVRRPCR